jgi:hypothetical protein
MTRRLPILVTLVFAGFALTALGVLLGQREDDLGGLVIETHARVVSASQAVRAKGPSQDQSQPQVPTQGGSAAKLTEGAKK